MMTFYRCKHCKDGRKNCFLRATGGKCLRCTVKGKTCVFPPPLEGQDVDDGEEEDDVDPMDTANAAQESALGLLTMAGPTGEGLSEALPHVERTPSPSPVPEPVPPRRGPQRAARPAETPAGPQFVPPPGPLPAQLSDMELLKHLESKLDKLNTRLEAEVDARQRLLGALQGYRSTSWRHWGGAMKMHNFQEELLGAELAADADGDDDEEPGLVPTDILEDNE